MKAVLVAIGLFSACGYRFTAPGGPLPHGIRSVKVPVMNNVTPEPSAETFFTQALRDKGSAVLIPVPAWPAFAEAPRVAGGTCGFTQLSPKSGVKLTARHVAKVISTKTRAVVVNSPVVTSR